MGIEHIFKNNKKLRAIYQVQYSDNRRKNYHGSYYPEPDRRMHFGLGDFIEKIRHHINSKNRKQL